MLGAHRLVLDNVRVLLGTGATLSLRQASKRRSFCERRKGPTHRGATRTFTFNVAAGQGFTGAVNFSVSGLPANVFPSFDPPTVTGSGSVVLALEVGDSTEPGKYELTITGASGTLLHSVGVELQVQE